MSSLEYYYKNRDKILAKRKEEHKKEEYPKKVREYRQRKKIISELEKWLVENFMKVPNNLDVYTVRETYVKLQELKEKYK